MSAPRPHTLPEEERLKGTTAVQRLMSHGRWGGAGHLRFCWVENGDSARNRIMVSVPKRQFKRAVKRNLLKRRLREAYRTQKELLDVQGVDFLVSYNCAEVLDSAAVHAEMAEVLRLIAQQARAAAGNKAP